MLTQHDLRVEVVHQLGYKLAFNGQLVGQHAQVVAQTQVLRDDDAQPAVPRTAAALPSQRSAARPACLREDDARSVYGLGFRI